MNFSPDLVKFSVNCVTNPQESIDEYDTIIPFCTNEGSGMGSSVRFIKKLCPDANVDDGTTISDVEKHHEPIQLNGFQRNTASPKAG